MNKKWIGSIVLSAILLSGIVGCNSNSTGTTQTEVEKIILELKASSDKAIKASLVGVEDKDKIPFGDGSFSPFERVAVLDVVRGTDGKVDHNATNTKIISLAQQFALSVANINEPAEDNATFQASDWIIIDKKKTGDVNLTVADIKPHLIQIPTSKPMNPNFAYATTNTRKVQLIELCNPIYAGRAAGAKIIGGAEGDFVPKGSYHATALPCEVTIYSDDKAIYIDMLNPETIFTLFFTEVFSHEVMNNNDFKTAMLALPTQVKKEITTMIHNWLDNQGESYHKTSIKMGSIYSSMSKAIAIPKKSAPYKHFNYAGSKTFTPADAKAIAQTIMEVMTIHGQKNAGTQESALLTALPSKTQTTPVQPKWRSARHEAFKVPGGIYVIEACSPIYAKEALNTGEFHTPALPCEISVQVNPTDSQSIDISILNPDFMFNALFADGMADMNASSIASFQNIIDNINGDLKKIVDYAMENNVTDITGSATEITPISY